MKLVKKREVNNRQSGRVLARLDKKNYVVEDPCEELDIVESEDKTIVPTPHRDMRDVFLIFGPSGSGKSHFAALYMKEYQKQYPKRTVFLFSNVDQDEHFNSSVVRINLSSLDVHEDLKKTGLFDDSLVIFDDIETIMDNRTRIYVQKLMMDLLTTGRHSNTSVIVIAHVLVGKQRDMIRAMITEARCITFFPKSGQFRQINQLLEKDLGLDTRTIRKLFKIKSRWVCLSVTGSPYVIAENVCFPLS